MHLISKSISSGWLLMKNKQRWIRESSSDISEGWSSSELSLFSKENLLNRDLKSSIRLLIQISLYSSDCPNPGASYMLKTNFPFLSNLLILCSCSFKVGFGTPSPIVFSNSFYASPLVELMTALICSILCSNLILNNWMSPVFPTFFFPATIILNLV